MSLPTWIQVTPDKGSGNGTIIVTATPHTGRVKRGGGSGDVITIASGAIRRTIIASQEPKGEFVTAIATCTATANGQMVKIEGKSNASKLTFSWKDGSAWNIVIPEFAVNEQIATNGESIEGDPGAIAEYEYSLSIAIPNNTSESELSGIISVLTEGGQTAETSISQAAGVKVYEVPVITDFAYTKALADGTAAVVRNFAYYQDWTWNGVPGSGGKLTTGGTVVYSGAGVNETNGEVAVSNLGGTEKEETKITAATVSVSMNGKEATKSVDVYQEANIATHISQSASIGTGITAAGGSATITGACVGKWTSGADYTSGIVSVAIKTNGNDRFSVSDTTLSHSTMGSSVTTDTCTIVATFEDGHTAEATVSVENFNDLSSHTATASIGTGITAAGGSATVSGVCSGTYASGEAFSTSTISKVEITSNGNSRFSVDGTTISHSSMGTNATTDTCSIKVTFDDGHTATASVSATNAVTGTGNYNGFTQNCYQSYTEYQVVSFASVGDIPAYGGTSYAQGTGQSRTNYKGSSYTKYEIHNEYTSGSHAHNGSYTSASGWTDGNTPSATEWGGNTTVTGSNVTGASLGKTTTTAKTNRGNSTTTWNGVACSAAIYQAINSKSSTAGTALNARTQACYQAYTEYQIINFASLGDVPASGGTSKGQGTGQSRTNYSTSSYTKYDYYYTWTAYAGDSSAKEYSYSNTASGWTDGSAPSASAWGGNTTVTGSDVSGSNLTTTAKARTHLGNSSVTWNGKTASVAIYQAANTRNSSATHYSTSSAQSTYRFRISGATSVPEIAASGGTVHATFQAQIDYGTYYIYYYAYYYTSGSADGHYSSNGSVSWNNSWGNYTTVAGSDVSGSHLGTSSTSRTWKGTSSYSGTYGSGSADIYQAANTITSTSWNNPSISTFSYSSSSFAAAGGTSSSPTVSASQSGTHTWTSGSTSTASNSSFSKSYSMSATGFSVNSSTGVVTAGNNTGAARSGTVTVTVTGSGSKTATKTFTFSQAVGITFVDLGLPSGTKWMDKNIGAANATSLGTWYTKANISPDIVSSSTGGSAKLPSSNQWSEICGWLAVHPAYQYVSTQTWDGYNFVVTGKNGAKLTICAQPQTPYSSDCYYLSNDVSNVAHFNYYQESYDDANISYANPSLQARGVKA